MLDWLLCSMHFWPLLQMFSVLRSRVTFWKSNLSLFLYRRLDPSERPLQMVYDYLTAMGYDDPLRVQQEAANSDLSCMIRFYSGEFVERSRSLCVLPASFVLNVGSTDQVQIQALQMKLFQIGGVVPYLRETPLVDYFCLPFPASGCSLLLL